VVKSQLLYVAPVWVFAVIATAKFRRNLKRPQKIAALRTIRAYRTVSEKAAFLLAGMPPIDLITEKRIKIMTSLYEDPPPGELPISQAKKKKPGRKATIAE